MLAKMWKKVLLAVCIIACIFNIMNKLVGRSSLENNLKNVKGESILSILKQDENKQTDIENNGSITESASNVLSNTVQDTTETDISIEVVENKTSDYVVIY